MESARVGRTCTLCRGSTSDTSLKLGALFEFGLIATQIATAVVIYPLVRRQSETVALGYVTARIMESVFAAIGIMSIISVVNVDRRVEQFDRRQSDRAHYAGQLAGAHL